MALKESYGGAPWNTWPTPLRTREPAALAGARTSLAARISVVAFSQFLFFRQWDALRDYAHTKDIKIIGDIPIFVALDSADVWANPDLYYLNKAGKPTVVAGVPPDYFAPTGQLWGNPLHRWKAHKRSGYAWWIERIRASLKQVDIVRIDHSAALPVTGKCPAKPPLPKQAAGFPAPVQICSMPSTKRSATCPSSPKTWA